VIPDALPKRRSLRRSAAAGAKTGSTRPDFDRYGRNISAGIKPVLRGTPELWKSQSLRTGRFASFAYRKREPL
jgi:hypothetical protein